MNTSPKKASETFESPKSKKLRPVDPKIGEALYRPNYWRRAAPQQQRTIP
jgi:hypothetical protein